MCCVRDVFWIAGNQEGEGGTWPIIPLCPQTAMMSFDDGATDGEADTHPVTFCGVEGVKELVHRLRVDAGAGIPHRQAHPIAVPSLRFDQQSPRAMPQKFMRSDAGKRIAHVPPATKLPETSDLARIRFKTSENGSSIILDYGAIDLDF